jgi:hypothetical protein
MHRFCMQHQVIWCASPAALDSTHLLPPWLSLTTKGILVSMAYPGTSCLSLYCLSIFASRNCRVRTTIIIIIIITISSAPTELPLKTC